MLPTVAAVIVTVAVSAVVLRSRRKAPPPPAAAAVVIAEDGVTLNGTVRPQHVVGVAAGVAGNIDMFLVEVGEDVFQGQALARIGSTMLDHDKENAAQSVEKAQDQVSKMEAAVNSARLEASRAEADAQRAKAQLDRLQKAFERQTTLHREGATPKLVYEKAVLEYEAAIKEFDIMDKAMRGARENVQVATRRVADARAMVAQKQEELQESEKAYEGAEVRAPADGTVVARAGEVGKPADEAGNQLFQIATDLYAMEVTLEAKPDVLKRLHPGQSATVMVLDIPNMGLPGTVKEVKETEVIVEFQNTLLGIKPGMRADVRFRFE